jgi:hydroxymethylglutaryl-CoA lyase
MKPDHLHITECPRDAMQGIRSQIPTAEKAKYLNSLLRVGFDRIDAGSFVSQKAIPQMADTKEVFSRLDLTGSSSALLAIIANKRGAEDAAACEAVSFLGYPFSVSETFQLRNTQAGLAESLERLDEISNICLNAGKKLQVYLSMAFGNPYGDPWSPELVMEWAARLSERGVKHIALADTTGISDVASISSLFTALLPAMPEVEFSAHLHARPEDVEKKALAAWKAGCRSFDTALKGFGGCPMAEDKLTGNMDTELLLAALKNLAVNRLDEKALKLATDSAHLLFNKYH